MRGSKTSLEETSIVEDVSLAYGWESTQVSPGAQLSQDQKHCAAGNIEPSTREREVNLDSSSLLSLTSASPEPVYILLHQYSEYPVECTHFFKKSITHMRRTICGQLGAGRDLNNTEMENERCWCQETSELVK